MNEELKILIKAITDDAKKKLSGIRKEIQEIDKKSKDAKKSISEALGGITKGAGIAIGSIVALTTAIVTLGKSSEEFRKAQAKVNTAFQTMGSNSAQATDTFGKLFRFMGDTASAAETAQSLALITTNEKELAEWTTILQGVYSAMGDKLPVNTLAEAANETIRVSKVTGTMADALNWLGVSEDAFNEQLEATVSLEEREALVRNTLNGLYSQSASLYEQNNAYTLKYNESQYKMNVALAEASKYTVPLMTALNNLGITLFNVFGSALREICAYLVVFVEWIAKATLWVGSFFGLFDSVGDSISSVKTTTSGVVGGVSGLGTALGDATAKAKELKKQTMGFDELNVVSSQSSSGASSGGGASGGASVPSLGELGIEGIADGMQGFKDQLEEARQKTEAILVLVGLVAIGLLGWKILSISDWAKVLGILQTIGGVLLIVAGAFLLIEGYTDAWVNGIDWVNFGEMLGGIALIVGGLYLAFGSLAAALGMVLGGVALIIVSIKDLIENGYSMEAVITLAIGVILVLVGAIWAMNAALLANPITWIIVGIVALVAAIVILWNECDWFKNAIVTAWNWIIDAFKAVGAWLKTFFTETIPNFFKTVINFVKENWLALLLLLVNPFAGAFKLLYDNCDGFREFIDKWVAKIGQFFKDLWSGIKSTFSSVGKWFSDTFSDAWKGIKNAFSSVKSFFSNIWTSIKNTFSNVGSTIGNAISSTVKTAINGVLSTAVKIINGFISAINTAISVINAIPGVEIKKLTKLEVPKLATGGILTKESLFVGGEGGKKEAVLPLEQNTEWMDILADRIANRNGTPSKIVLTLDGKELGWANINSINDITRQTGTLPLVLA